MSKLEEIIETVTWGYRVGRQEILESGVFVHYLDLSNSFSWLYTFVKTHQNSVY